MIIRYLPPNQYRWPVWWTGVDSAISPFYCRIYKLSTADKGFVCVISTHFISPGYCHWYYIVAITCQLAYECTSTGYYYLDCIFDFDQVYIHISDRLVPRHGKQQWWWIIISRKFYKAISLLFLCLVNIRYWAFYCPFLTILLANWLASKQAICIHNSSLHKCTWH